MQKLLKLIFTKLVERWHMG